MANPEINITSPAESTEGMGKRLQSTIEVLKTLKTLPKNVSEVGENYIIYDAQNFGEKYYGVASEKRIALIIDKMGNIRVGSNAIRNGSVKSGIVKVYIPGDYIGPNIDGTYLVGEKAKKSYMTPDAIAEFVDKLSKLATDQKSTEDAKKMEIAARKRAVLGNTLEK